MPLALGFRVLQQFDTFGMLKENHPTHTQSSAYGKGVGLGSAPCRFHGASTVPCHFSACFLVECFKQCLSASFSAAWTFAAQVDSLSVSPWQAH